MTTIAAFLILVSAVAALYLFIGVVVSLVRLRRRRHAPAKPSPTTAALAAMFKRCYSDADVIAAVNRPSPMFDAMTKRTDQPPTYTYRASPRWGEPTADAHDPGDEDVRP